ncbi:MAG: hypothetical protein ACRYGM_05635 [Janthinobacterium lividum]
MRILLTLVACAGLAVSSVAVLAPTVLAQSRPAHPPAKAAKPAASNAPKSIGKFEDWQAATHAESGQTVCYAFTRAQSSSPALPGRGDVVLTVTQRPSGRDAVAISAGFTFASNAEVMVTADKAELPFYTSARSAFAREGHAATVAFGGARQAVAKSPGPKATAVTDTFSLRGYSAAYAAIVKACPAK